MTTIPVTDPAILQQLNGANAGSGGRVPVTDTAILAKLNSGQTQEAPGPTSAQDASLQTYGKQGNVSDIALSIMDALPKGVLSILGGPRAIQDLAESLAKKMGSDGSGAYEGASPQMMGGGEVSARLPSYEDMRGGLEKLIGQPLYEPQTTAGRYAGAGAEMLAAPGGKVMNVATGVGGEGGADIAKSLGLPEPVGRLIGSLVTALAPLGFKMVRTNEGLPKVNDIAARDVLDQVGPSTTTPTEIAPRVQTAAENVVNDTRKAVNDVAKPYYDASKNVTVSPSDWAVIEKNPAFQIALKQVRADPLLNDGVKHLPDNSVGVLDVVKKHLDDLERAASSKLTGEQRFKAGELSKGAQATKEAAVNASPDYERALEIGSTGRSQVLEPLERSPLGQLSDKEKIAEQAKILFPANPLPGSETQIGDAVRTVARADPEAARMLVRHHLEQTFNELTQQTTTGTNSKGAAAFAANIVGNSQQAKNLKSALEALPGGDESSKAFLNLLKIFQKQGESMAPGEIAKVMERGGTLGQTLQVLGTPIRNIHENLSYARNVEKLAEVMTNPEKIKQMRQIAGINPTSATAQALFRSLVATNQGQE